MKRLITLLTISIAFTFFHSCTSNSNKDKEKKETYEKVEVEDLSINEESKLIVKSLQDKIYINIYMSGDLSPQFQKIQSSITSTLEEFQNISNKEIDFEYITINDDSTESKKGIYNPLINLDLHPIWATTDTDKVHKTYPYAIVHFREKTLPVLLYNSLYYDTISDPSDESLERCVDNLEYNFIESFYLIQQEEKKKIAFLYGNGELDSTQTWDIRNTLKKYYDIEFFNLNTDGINLISNYTLKDAENQIKQIAQYKAIIIAKPQQFYDNMEKLVIDQYIMNGGKTLWLLDGTSAHMDNFGNNLEFQIEKNQLLLGEYLSIYGAKVNHDLIQDEKCSKSPMIFNNNIAYVNWQYNPVLLTTKNYVITSKEDSILTNFVSSIEIIKPEKTTVLLSSSDKSNVINAGKNVNLDIIKNPPNKSEGRKTAAVLIEDEFSSNFLKVQETQELTIKRKSSQNKMIIISDGDIISNLYSPPNFYYPLGYYHYGRNVFDGNTNFILNCIQYLCDDEVLLKIWEKNR